MPHISTLLVPIQKIPKKNLDVLKVHDKNWDLLKVPEKNHEALKMVACLGPQSHGEDAGGDPPQRPTKRIPSQREGLGKRGVSKHQNLKKAFKNNGP
ncbi:hypothetical protein Tco_0371796 [Tanacetum coccineum]